MPERLICERHPAISRSTYGTLLTFIDNNGNKVYAIKEGYQFSPPETHESVEIEVLEKSKEGYILKWNWKYYSEVNI